jgi:glutamine synthetase adenylyltransferase
LRKVEDRLRLMHNRSLNELPSDTEELDKLALRLDLAGVGGQRPGEVLVGSIESHIQRSHRVFEKQIEKLRKG